MILIKYKKIGKDLVSVYRYIGNCYSHIGEAEKSLEEAPWMYYNHCEKGYSHMKLGQRAEGIHHLKLCKQASEENDDFKNKALYEEYLK